MRRRLGFFGLILGLLLPLVVAIPAAAQGGSAMVGTTSISFNNEWSLSSSSTDSIAYLTHNGTQPETAYFYTEVDDTTLPIPDALYVIEMVILPNFRSSYEVTTTPYLAQGGQATETPAPNAWELVSADLPTGSVLVLFAADMNRVPGKAAVEYMIVTPQDLPLALASAQTGITMNGQPNQFAGIDPAAVLSGAGIQPSASAPQQQPPQPPQVSTQAPVVSTEPPDPVTPATGTATVGADSVTYGGEWQYSAENSDATVGLFQSTANPQLVYGYFITTGAPSDATTALQQFRDGFFSDFAPGSVQSMPIETLPSGAAWSVHVASEDGVSSVYLMLVDASTPGTFRVQVLNAPVEQFPAALASIQGAILINGTGALSGVDPAHVTTLIGGGSAPVAGQATDTPVVATTAGCDATGSVITDPSQRPSTQAEIDQRSVCVGGATYVATCGTYLDTGLGVQCTINVVVGSSPMAVTSQQFTLIDAAGVRYPVDVEAMMMHIMLLGGPELPETTVQANTTTSGTVIFNPPADAATPWVIEVAPDTIASTGEQPGTLVIEGPLQSFSVFEQ